MKLTDTLIRALQVERGFQRIAPLIGRLNKEPKGLFELLFNNSLDADWAFYSRSAPVLRKLDDSLKVFDDNYFDGDSWLKAALVECCDEKKNNKKAKIRPSRN